MGDAAQGGFDAAEDDGHIGIELFEDFRIDDGGVLRPHIVTAVR